MQSVQQKTIPFSLKEEVTSQPRASVSETKLMCCLHCGADLRRLGLSPAQLRRAKFCNRSCFAEYRRLRTRCCCDCGKYLGKRSPSKRCGKCNGLTKRKGTKRPCRHCGKLVYRAPYEMTATSRRHGVFCNHKCFSGFYCGKNNPQYAGGPSVENYPSKFKTIKKRILARDKNCCFLCLEENGLVGTKKPRRSLEVHHIDWTKSNCDESNLVTLCKRCHEQHDWSELRAEEVTALACRLSLLVANQYGYQPTSITSKLKETTTTLQTVS